MNSLANFCDKNEIKWFPISLTITRVTDEVYLIYENYKTVAVPKLVESGDEDDGGNLLNDLYAKFEITNNKSDEVLVSLVNDMMDYDKGTIKNELNAINCFKKQSSKKDLRKKYVYTGLKIIVKEEKVEEENM